MIKAKGMHSNAQAKSPTAKDSRNMLVRVLIPLCRHIVAITNPLPKRAATIIRIMMMDRVIFASRVGHISLASLNSTVKLDDGVAFDIVRISYDYKFSLVV